MKTKSLELTEREAKSLQLAMTLGYFRKEKDAIVSDSYDEQSEETINLLRDLVDIHDRLIHLFPELKG